MEADALIFDMDGTLWDSSETVASSWNKVISKCPLVHERLTADRMKCLMGMQLFDIGKVLFPYIEESERNRLVTECCDYETEVLKHEGGKLFNGLEKTLKQLKPFMKLLIVSNCQSGYIEAFFEYHKLNRYFSDYQCAGKDGRTKGENIIEIIRRNNVKSAYYVGDTEIDYEATRKACIPFIYASYGFGKVKNFEYKINDITDLANMFTKT